MKHKKLKHIEEIKDCSKYLTGDCGFSDEYFWNRHAANKKNNNSNNNSKTINNQDFQRGSGTQDPPENLSLKNMENLAERNLALEEKRNMLKLWKGI